MFWFKRKDPICGMKEIKGKGIVRYDNWFCSDRCSDEYEKEIQKAGKEHKSGCCH